MEIVSKLMRTWLVLGMLFAFFGIATAMVGKDDPRIEKINNILMILTGICFGSCIILIVFSLLVDIWR